MPPGDGDSIAVEWCFLGKEGAVVVDFVYKGPSPSTQKESPGATRPRAIPSLCAKGKWAPELLTDQGTFCLGHGAPDETHRIAFQDCQNLL